MNGNLIIEMRKKKIVQTDVSKLLGLSLNSTNKKINGKIDFTQEEMFQIQKAFFPKLTLEYLFEKK